MSVTAATAMMARLAAHFASARTLPMAETYLLAWGAGRDLRFAVARGDHQRSAHRRPVCFVA
jgi:hypothetical protein